MKSASVKALESIEPIPDNPQNGEVYEVDTAELFAALEGEANNTRSLERVCKLLDMQDLKLFHNAGNDAYVGVLGSWFLPRHTC